MANSLEFVRGDANYHTFSIPSDSWTPGGTLYFAAKPAIDDDTSDGSEVIEGIYTDANVSDNVQIIDGVSTPVKTYLCYFPPAATSSIQSDGASKTKYLGEFQLVDATGVPTTYPYNDKKLQVIVYFDVKRSTTT